MKGSINFPLTLAAADRAHSRFWTGGSDAQIEGIWKWYKESSPITYTNWYPGEPNQMQGANCLLLWGAQNFTWADNACHRQFHFICEKRLDILFMRHWYLSHMHKCLQ